MRDATASLLDAQEGLTVLGTFESSAEFLAAQIGDPPVLILLDCDGVEHSGCGSAVAALSAPGVDWRVVLLCQEIKEEVIRCAIVPGVGGILLKNYSRQDMCSAIAYIATGRTVMPAGWQQLVPPSSPATAELSPRLREILKMIGEGRCNREIATELGLSSNTVKFHIRVLYSRLGVRNRVEAANEHARMTRGGG